MYKNKKQFHQAEPGRNSLCNFMLGKNEGSGKGVESEREKQALCDGSLLQGEKWRQKRDPENSAKKMKDLSSK